MQNFRIRMHSNNVLHHHAFPFESAFVQVSNLNAIRCGLFLLLPFVCTQYLFCPFSIQVSGSLRLCDVPTSKDREKASYFIPTNFRLLNRTCFVEVTHESLSNDSLIKTKIIYCALKMQHGLGQHSMLEKLSKYVDLDIYQTFLEEISVLWSTTSCVKNEGRCILSSISLHCLSGSVTTFLILS